MTNLRFSHLKFLLLPRYITVSDLERILEGVDPSPIMKLQLPDNVKLHEIIVYRALNLVEVKDMEYILKENKVRFWNEVYQRIILEMLKRRELKEYALFVLIEWLSIVFMIISIYFRDRFKSLGGSGFKSPFIISEKAIMVILDSLLDDTLLNALEQYGLKHVFEAFFWSYGVTYKYLAEMAKDDERLSVKEPLNKIQNFLSTIDLKILQDDPLAKLVLSSLIFMPLNVALKYKVKKEKECFPMNPNQILELLEETYSKTENFTDLAQQIHFGISRVLKLIISGRLEEGVSTLRELGKLIFDEKMNLNLFGLTERVLLKLPVETAALEIPPIHILINLADELSEVGLVLIQNEIRKAAVNIFFETRLLLQSFFVLYPDKVIELIEKAIDDELASITILTVFGSISSRLFETLGLFIEDGQLHTDFDKYITVIIDFLDKMFKKTKALIKDDQPISLQRIIVFPLYREVFYTASKITPQIRSTLEKTILGQKFLKLIDDIFSFIESITKPKVEKKEEEPKDISDLYI